MPCACDFCVCDRQRMGPVKLGCECELCVRYRFSFNTVLISLAVVRHKDKFVSVDEGKEGWYLPAGRVDSGETFATGARREALEEAGCEIELTGVLRFEHFPSNTSRFRAIYEAKPVNPKAPLKSLPDKESDGAAWVTVKDLAKLRLRSREVLDLFTWASKGAKPQPLGVLTGCDGSTVDSRQVFTRLYHAVKLVVIDGDRLLLRRAISSLPVAAAFNSASSADASSNSLSTAAENSAPVVTVRSKDEAPSLLPSTLSASEFSLPFAYMQGDHPLEFEEFAHSVLASACGRACPDVDIKSLAGIWHHAPDQPDQVGEIGMAFAAEMKSKSLSDKDWESLGFCWVPHSQVTPALVCPQDYLFVDRVCNRQSAPLTLVDTDTPAKRAALIAKAKPEAALKAK